MSLLDFQDISSTEQEPEVFAGTIADDATAVGQPVRVIIPALSDQLAHGPCPWTPITTAAGAFYPKVGDRCQMAQPVGGEPWIVGWTPRAENPDAPIGVGWTIGDGLDLEDDELSVATSIARINDGRFPTADEKAALAGTNGTPDDVNRYVTDDDPRNANAREPTPHDHDAADVTDLAATVKGYRLDEFAAPTSAVSMNSQKLTGLADGTASGDAVNLGQLAAAGGRPPLVTLLPADPFDGQEIYFDTGTPGVVWHLRYDSGISGSYKWVYLGGLPLVAREGGFVGKNTNTAWGTLSTQNTLSPPLVGVYRVELRARMNPASTTVIGDIAVSVDNGSNFPVFAVYSGSAGWFGEACAEGQVTITGSNLFKEYVRTRSNATMNYAARMIAITPILVG